MRKHSRIFCVPTKVGQSIHSPIRGCVPSETRLIDGIAVRTPPKSISQIRSQFALGTLRRRWPPLAEKWISQTSQWRRTGFSSHWLTLFGQLKWRRRLSGWRVLVAWLITTPISDRRTSSGAWLLSARHNRECIAHPHPLPMGGTTPQHPVTPCNSAAPPMHRLSMAI